MSRVEVCVSRVEWERLTSLDFSMDGWEGGSEP
jgi:hypothetical protein